MHRAMFHGMPRLAAVVALNRGFIKGKFGGRFRGRGGRGGDRIGFADSGNVAFLAASGTDRFAMGTLVATMVVTTTGMARLGVRRRGGGDGGG